MKKKRLSSFRVSLKPKNRLDLLAALALITTVSVIFSNAQQFEGSAFEDPTFDNRINQPGRYYKKSHVQQYVKVDTFIYTID